MRKGPVLFAGVVRCKETIVRSVADLVETGGYDLAEALFIADFVHELVGAHEDTRLAECSQSEDGAW